MTEILSVSNFNYTHEWKLVRSGIPILPNVFSFLGLESLHQLTKQGMYDMYVLLTIYGTDKGKLWYRNIRVDSEADRYALHWDHFERDRDSRYTSAYLDGFGGAGDATKNLNGALFGTYDRDVNGCATAKGIGWWYNPRGCMIMDIVPNGVYWPTDRSGTISNEYINIFKIRLISVNMYVEDDLVF